MMSMNLTLPLASSNAHPMRGSRDDVSQLRAAAAVAPYHTRSFSDSSNEDGVTAPCSERSSTQSAVDSFVMPHPHCGAGAAQWAASPNPTPSSASGRTNATPFQFRAGAAGAPVNPSALPPPPAYAAISRSLMQQQVPANTNGPAPTPSYILPPPMLPAAAGATAPAGGSPTGGSATGSPRPFRHDPYGTRQGDSPSQQSQRVAHGISHQPLVGRCRYVSWPQRLDSPNTPVVSSLATGESAFDGMPRLLIEQVKFELEPAQLRWLFRELTGVVAVNVSEVDRGTFAAYFKNEGDMRAVRALHHAVLFDHSGAWCPATAEESTAVAQYMATREFRQRGQRLPRELMLVNVRRRSGAAPSTSPLQRGQQQQPQQ